MAVQLFKHNQAAYHAAAAMLAETGKAAVIHPTGTGRSFIGFQLCEENADLRVLWLSPSEHTFQTQIENWTDAGGKTLDNTLFITYAKLMLLSEEEIKALSPDILVMDEYRRAWGSGWKQGIVRVLRLFPDVRMLGLSAADLRSSDNQRDMAEELFDHHIAIEMTLGEAIAHGILHPPKYVLAICSYQKTLEKYENRIKAAKDKAVRDEASACLEALRCLLEQADGLDVLFEKYMTDHHGKYIVFTSNYDDMLEYMALAGDWFGNIDKDMHIYSFSNHDSAVGSSFQEFQADGSDHLRLLYCTDDLNEGVHAEDVSGVILLRPAASSVHYKQQIGRALAVVKSHDSVIFDVVNSIEGLYSIDSIKDEMREAVACCRFHGREGHIVHDSLEVIDRLTECKMLFEQLEGKLTVSWEDYDFVFERNYHSAHVYYQEHGDLECGSDYVDRQGIRLGAWLNYLRKQYKLRGRAVLTTEQFRLLDEIGMRWGSKHDRQWNAFYDHLAAYLERTGRSDVPANCKEGTFLLGRWFRRQRELYQAGKLREDRAEKLMSLGLQLAVEDPWEVRFRLAKAYSEDNGGRLNVPHDHVADGIWLSKWSKLYPYSKMVELVEQARIVITHGGPSSFIMPLQIGKIPIVVPRKKEFDEHVNDHQVDFAKAVAERQGNIIVVEDVHKVADTLENYDKIIREMQNGMQSNNKRFCDQFEKIVAGLVK